MAFESAEIVRVECDAMSKDRVYDKRDLSKVDQLCFWRGSDVAFQIAITHNGEHLLAPDMGKVIVELKDKYACPGDPSLWREELTTGDAGHTASTWSAGTTSLVTSYFPKEISQRLIPGEYWLIVKHDAGRCATHLSQRIEVREDHSLSVQTYNFSSGGTSTTSTGTPVSTQLSIAIPAGATSLTATVPAGFTPANYINHIVSGTGGVVELSDTVVLGAGDITFTVTGAPSSNGTHSLIIDFLKLT